MICYLDSSVLLRFLLAADDAIDPFTVGDEFIGSQLTRLECRRTLHRLRLENRLDDTGHATLTSKLQLLLESIDLVDISPGIVERAETNWGAILGSLDSLHLATALLYRENAKKPMRIATHDKALANAARIQQFEVTGI